MRNYILNMIDYIRQEIGYAPDDLRMWWKARKRDRAFQKKYRAICKKAGIKP